MNIIFESDRLVTAGGSTGVPDCDDGNPIGIIIISESPPRRKREREILNSIAVHIKLSLGEAAENQYR